MSHSVTPSNDDTDEILPDKTGKDAPRSMRSEGGPPIDDPCLCTPKLPANKPDGEYRLHAVKNGTTITYSWEPV